MGLLPVVLFSIICNLNCKIGLLTMPKVLLLLFKVCKKTFTAFTNDA